jgi:SET domain-containing protein
MMLVRTYIAPSPIQGLGIFAAETITAGHQIWMMHPLFDLVISDAEALQLPDAAQSFLLEYAYPHPHTNGSVVLDIDDGRFMNHRDEPNTRFLPEVGFAIARIEAGVEITCNYREFYPASRWTRFPFLAP